MQGSATRYGWFSAILVAFFIPGAGPLTGCGKKPVPEAAGLMTAPYKMPDFSGITISYPEAKRFETKTTKGAEQYYMVQEPETLSANAPMLLYMHGADGDETQGMDPEYAEGTFARLRSLLAQRGWLYVTARKAEYEGLRKELEVKYGKRPIVLSGSSLGGKQSLTEAMLHPDLYAGVIVMCPALPLSDPGPAQRLTMPVYIESGEKDVLIASVSRMVLGAMKRKGRPFIYKEIPEGTHRTPIEQIDWVGALEFVDANRP